MHAAVRVRVEGSRDGTERIAREFEIGRATLCRWAKRFGWKRPAATGASGVAAKGPGLLPLARFGRPYGGDAVGLARDLVTGSILPIRRVAAQVGVSPSTVLGWAARRGWERPPAKSRSRREAAERRAAAMADATGGRSRRAYPPEVVARAGELYRTTELSTRMIAARVKTTRERVAFWARSGGWTRPRDQEDPYGRVPRRRRRRAAIRPAS
jgi:transposase